MARKGISLIESLLALTFFLLIILSSLEFFGTAGKVFSKLQNAQTNRESALAALDKIKADVLQAGQGLLEPLNLAVVGGIECVDETLSLTSRAKTSALSADASRGQTTLGLEVAEDFTPGKTVCLFDQFKGEILEIRSVEKKTLILASPLSSEYLKRETTVLLLQKITYSLDSEKSTLRRKVNAGSPQPLLEGVLSFASGYDRTAHLVDVRLRLQSDPEKTHEILVFPKNMALAKGQ